MARSIAAIAVATGTMLMAVNAHIVTAPARKIAPIAMATVTLKKRGMRTRIDAKAEAVASPTKNSRKKFN